LDRWRIVYAITGDGKIVDVLTVRKRPPHDYGDLGQLLEKGALREAPATGGPFTNGPYNFPSFDPWRGTSLPG